MITKGIVESIVDNYSVKVRIPMYDKIDGAKNATPNSDLSIATVCTLPGAVNQVQVGDIVFVGFEDNDISRPVILGQLYRNIQESSLCSLNIDSIVVSNSAKFNEQTTIGDVSYKDISSLIGVRSNLQQQLDTVIDKINEITAKIDKLTEG